MWRDYRACRLNGEDAVGGGGWGGCWEVVDD